MEEEILACSSIPKLGGVGSVILGRGGRKSQGASLLCYSLSEWPLQVASIVLCTIYLAMLNYFNASPRNYKCTTAFRKCGYKDYKKWIKVLINDCMSSEDSCDDNTLVMRPLPWHLDLVNTFFDNRT